MSTLRSYSLAAIAALAVAATASVASAAIVHTKFQQQVPLICNHVNCTGYFTDLPANERIDLEYVGCEVSVGKDDAIDDASVYYQPGLGITVPLGLAWVRNWVDVKRYTFVSQAPLTIPLGKQLVVSTFNTTTSIPGGFCTAIGDLLTVN